MGICRVTLILGVLAAFFVAAADSAGGRHRNARQQADKPKDFYKMMGLKKDADQATVKKAYKRLARKYHPDVSDDPKAKEKMLKVNEAYETLSDEKKREDYDLGRGEHFSQQQGGGGGGFGGGGGGFNFDFASMFGGGGGGGGRRGGGSRQQQQRPQQRQKQQQKVPRKLVKEYEQTAFSTGAKTVISDTKLTLGKDFEDLSHLANIAAVKKGCTGFLVDPTGRNARLLFSLGRLRSKGKSWPVYLLREYSRLNENGAADFFKATHGAGGATQVATSVLEYGRQWRTLADLARLAQKSDAVGFLESGGKARLVKRVGYQRVDAADSWPFYVLGDSKAEFKRVRAKADEEATESSPQAWNELCFGKGGKGGGGGMKERGCLFMSTRGTPADNEYVERLAKEMQHTALVVHHTPRHAEHVPRRLLQHLGAPPSRYFGVLVKRDRYRVTSEFAFSSDPENEDSPWASFRASDTVGYPQPW